MLIECPECLGDQAYEETYGDSVYAVHPCTTCNGYGTIMPVQQGVDTHGAFYRWGLSGKKYHYDPKSESSRSEAFERAAQQGRAIKAQGGEK